MWLSVFPNVTISNYCQVSGKCFVCASIIERQQFFKTKAELEIMAEFASIHKILIQMQRATYQDIRRLAMEHPEMFMSVIIDGK